MNFYTSVFKGSKVGEIARYPAGTPGPEGSVMTATFFLQGQEFIALNGGPQFKFTEAISLVINCETQEEVDYYWEKLSEGGQKSMCGWLKDRYGLSWQVVPTILAKLAIGEKSAQVMQAMMKMEKLDIAKLVAAAEG